MTSLAMSLSMRLLRTRVALAMVVGLGVAGACSAPPSTGQAGSGVADSDDGGVSAGPEGGARPRVPGTLAITRLAYLASKGGPRTLIEGTAKQPGERVMFLMEFLGSTLLPTSVDDGAGGSIASLELMATADEQGDFFTAIQSTDGFDAKVHAIRVTATGADGTGLAPVIATFAEPPVRPRGAECSPRGFDRCETVDLCAPSSVGTSTCVAEDAYRAATCSDAPLLDLRGGSASLSGRTNAPSLWDAPVGCIQSGALGQAYPSWFARVHLDAPATVTLTTADPATDVDTVLFVLNTCGGRATKPLACNDDDVGASSSTVVLADLAAGDYVVVVQSATAAEGAFRLTGRLQ